MINWQVSGVTQLPYGSVVQEVVVDGPGSVQDELYRHHSTLTVYNGLIYLSWSQHDAAEDAPGQYVRYATSSDGVSWTIQGTLFAPKDSWDRQTMVPQSEGLYLVPDRWQVLNGTLYATANLNRKYYGYGTPDNRVGVDVLCRSVTGTTLGPETPIADVSGMSAVLAANPPQHAFLDRGAGIQWQPDRPHSRLCEPTTAGCVTIYRDLESTRMWVKDSDGLQPTDIPNAPSRACLIQLTDGRYLLFGNLQPDGTARRASLDVAVSGDGSVFDRAYRIHTISIPPSGGPMQVFQDDARFGGPQYPSAVEFGGKIVVAASVRKERISAFSFDLVAIP